MRIVLFSWLLTILFSMRFLGEFLGHRVEGRANACGDDVGGIQEPEGASQDDDVSDQASEEGEQDKGCFHDDGWGGTELIPV